MVSEYQQYAGGALLPGAESADAAAPVYTAVPVGAAAAIDAADAAPADRAALRSLSSHQAEVAASHDADARYGAAADAASWPAGVTDAARSRDQGPRTSVAAVTSLSLSLSLDHASSTHHPLRYYFITN